VRRTELRGARYSLERAETTRAAFYRVHAAGNERDVGEATYHAHSQSQALVPVVLLDIYPEKLWWYQHRFWWESDNLDADDVELLVRQRD
jgi:hypothetical protein